MAAIAAASADSREVAEPARVAHQGGGGWDDSREMELLGEVAQLLAVALQNA